MHMGTVNIKLEIHKATLRSDFSKIRCVHAKRWWHW